MKKINYIMIYKDSDIHQWPQSWKGTPEDVPCGDEIINLFKPFISALKKENFSEKTINRHIDNLWMLGGWLIAYLNNNPKDRKIKPEHHFLENIAGLDGPLIHDFSESEQKSFDATCRRFYAWMVENGYKIDNQTPIKKPLKRAAK